MSGEELEGPPAPKLLRLLYFVGAGFFALLESINGVNYRTSQFYSSSSSGSLKMPQMPLSDLQVFECSPGLRQIFNFCHGIWQVSLIFVFILSLYVLLQLNSY
ncbi:unnamed protein product [Prunus brigantina]